MSYGVSLCYASVIWWVRDRGKIPVGDHCDICYLKALQT
jgi:hypothetical protein